MAQIKWTLNVQVVGGPVFAIARTETVDAYDKVAVTVAPGGGSASEQTVEVQPGSAGSIRMLLIKSSLYGPELTFKANDGTNDSAEVALIGPQLYDTGSIALFEVDPKLLKFKNTHDDSDPTKAASIEILVGRGAV